MAGLLPIDTVTPLHGVPISRFLFVLFIGCMSFYAIFVCLLGLYIISCMSFEGKERTQDEAGCVV